MSTMSPVGKHWRPENFTWTRFGGVVWLCVETGKFHFADETEQFTPRGYDNFDGAQGAAERYGKWLHSGVIDD